MRRRHSALPAFSLSFLDIMSCGFGAVVLLFLIIKHQTDVAPLAPAYDLDAEIVQLEDEVAAARQAHDDTATRAADAARALAELGPRLAAAETALSAARSTAPPTTPNRREEIAALRASLARGEREKAALQAAVHARARDVRTYAGDGNREYLTGIQLGGERILILLDTSASMLDETIVNIIRRRNMDEESQRRAPKWRQALATVDWITARFPARSQYQIYTFDSSTRPALEETAGRWLPVADVAQLDRAVEALGARLPAGSSNLERALLTLTTLDPPPDNVYLITDGLPTQGLTPSPQTTIDGPARLRLFEQAVTRIPRGIPLNVILLPMEGDPMASAAYWQIALATKGAFLSPASDWP